MINLLPSELRKDDLPVKKTPEDIKLRQILNDRKPMQVQQSQPVRKELPTVQPLKIEKSEPIIDVSPKIMKPASVVKREIVGDSSSRGGFWNLFGRKARLTMDLLKTENEEVYGQAFFEILSQMARVVFVFSVVFVLMFFGAKFYKVSVLNLAMEKNKELAFLKSEVAQYESSKSDVVKISKRFAMIKSLLDKHIYWNNFFNNLEALTLPGVKYGELVAGDDGKVTLSAIADSYSRLALQLDVFLSAKDFVKKVEINSGSLTGVNSDEVAFQVNLELADKFLNESSQK